MRGFKRFHRNLAVDTSAQWKKWPVIFAFVADIVAAVAKTVAAVLTGSASMLAEAVHSWVNTVTECFLVASYFAARRPADAVHSLGYGRESYVWSLFASLGMFIVGAEVGVWHGIHQLGAPDKTTDYLFGYVVIAISFALEGASFRQALIFVRKRAAERDQGVFEHVFRTSDTQLRAVFIEDFIAPIALAIAALGMALHELTGKAVYDAAGSILIGVLMGVTGLVLINLNRQFLAGMPLTPEQRAVVLRLLRSAPEIECVTTLFAEFIGPDRLLIAARVAIAGDHTQTELAHVLRELEQRIEAHDNVGRAMLSLSLPEEPDL